MQLRQFAKVNGYNYCFTPDSRFLVIQDYGRGFPDKDYSKLWSIENQQERGSIEGYFWRMAFASGENRFATVVWQNRSNKGRVVRGRLADGNFIMDQEFPIIADHTTFSTDLSRLATSTNSTHPDKPAELALWDMASGTKTCSFPCEQNDWHIQRIQFAGNGSVLIANGGGGDQLSWHTRTILWNVTTTPRELGSFSETPTVSANGKWATVPHENGADLFELETMTKVGDLMKSGDVGPSFFGRFNGMTICPSAIFSPDSSIVAVGRLHNPGQESFLAKWLPQKIDIFSRQRLFSAIRLWDVRSQRELLTVPEGRHAVFSPDGSTLAIVHQDKTIKLWALPLSKPMVTVLGASLVIWLPFFLIVWLGICVARRRRRS